MDPNLPMWKRVTEEVVTSDWRLGSMVALVQWLPSLERSRMPAILLEALEAGTTIDLARLRDLNIKEAAEVAQWSDLVVFDYLTGNYDRVASMQVILLEQYEVFCAPAV